MKRVGITGWGVSIPCLRISIDEIDQAWGRTPRSSIALGIREKAVPNCDEDTVTLAVEAGRNAILRAGIKPTQLGAVYIGSESHPYAVKPTATITAEALGVGHTYMAADTEFACKAGTAALQMMIGLVVAGMISDGLAIGSDIAQAAPGDILECSAGAGAGAYIIGTKNIAAECIDTLSYSSDTPDFWRREGERYPRHAGRFTGEPAYFRHITEAAKLFFERTKTGPENYDHAVFHMPNGKFPRVAAQRLGFAEAQIKTGLVVGTIGNPYSGSTLIGLARVLDHARSDQNVLVVSYGSGSGSDVFAFKTTKQLPQIQNRARTADSYLRNSFPVNYTRYSRLRQNLNL